MTALHRTCWLVAAVLLGMVAALFPVTPDKIPAIFFRQQDLPVLIVAVAALVYVGWRAPSGRLPELTLRLPMIAVAAVLLALVLWAGTYFVMYDYPLTRDEHMVVFDMDIFRGGNLAQPLAPGWREFSDALVPDFLLDVPGHALLVSNYMPGNAMMRTAFSYIADPALVNPLLAAGGLVALFDIARRLFPGNSCAILVVLASYVLSAQVLATAMTAYAMTGHLALNLIWLALFLRGRWWQHLVAMGIGVWAIGLHQIVFHPLFAGPILLTLLPQRRWGLFAAYSAAYAAGLLFWISYPAMVVDSFGIAAADGSVQGARGFFEYRVKPLFENQSLTSFKIMAFNLARFAAWMPLFLLPLVALSREAIVRRQGMALALFGSIAATLLAMLVLLPYQGHGWGYRYFHGVIGNFALLAGYGYVRWAKADRKAADGSVLALGAVTAAVTLPMCLWAAHGFIRPYAQLQRTIDAQDSDFVIVDTHPGLIAADLVRNRADMSNRPVILWGPSLSAAQTETLCERGSITAMTRADLHRSAFSPPLLPPSSGFVALTKGIAGRPCLRSAR
ncbi:hypothetical protein [Tsuneonella amylolytica]|uniref:hypothetical protein n=1 Tax=Tsuneonella amylolytica TaxID=2338327 RepID=UPI000EA9A994|nr:hypothetical protein [Tsuneonella amylolytica]